ncbi:glycosyltransferase family 2 protein [Massilia atriviolacea]|uniref:Glycosyltransferase family 2 protein n=1 Tax=Massilia atriviolacea TaxID=2495579 RepID=A0A430HSF2_9BURK|nr:glycosyltransferase family 2 protein [Massilia atriviolacea]RSZ60475.1 glycosyltransferase family 2 protein [Massilia atriviolacea]
MASAPATALPSAWRSPRLRDDFLLSRAVEALQAGFPGDALLGAEALCRRHPDLPAPALLRAVILQSLGSPLAGAAFLRAWRCDPHDPDLQDKLLAAWLAAGEHAKVAALAQSLLAQRCKAGNHASLLAMARAAGLAAPGACWREGDAIEGLLCDPGPSPRLLLRDEHGGQQYEVRPEGARFRFTPPHPDGVWSLALAGAADALPGSPLAFAAPRPAAGTLPAPAPLTVLVPLYRGLEQARACVASVLASLPANRAGARLLLIDDASGEPALSSWLASLEAHERVSVLRNRYNLGFIESVNRGLRQCAGHDVLLLNADTLVHGDWIDRLRAALYRAPDIASVSPWSNNGEISSFPDIGRAAPVPGAARLRLLDDSAAALHRDGATADVEVPACCGFAMLMRAGALAAIGTLDGAALERGYGEEVDWCLRARAAGYRHCVATGVFVAHAGGVSFGAEKHLRVRQNRAVLLARYPDYYSSYQRFLRDDPLAGARAALAARAGQDADGQGADGAPPRPPAPVFAGAPASSCTRIALWHHRIGSPQAAQVLALARLVAARADDSVRLLVIGEASELLWATGVVDALPQAGPHGDALLDDTALLAVGACAVVLLCDGDDLPVDIDTVRLGPAFDARYWFSAWLDAPAAAAPLRYAHNGAR